MADCVFCKIIAGETDTKIEAGSANVIQITPLNPVVEGHKLFIPVKHVKDALDDSEVTAMTMRFAASMAEGPCNFITSVGREATQSVFHLHIHLVPRKIDDGLALPWYSGKGNH